MEIYPPSAAKGRYPLSKWLADSLPSYVLEDGTEVKIAPDPRKMRRGRSVPMMTLSEFRDFLDSEISPSLRLWVDCRTCGGEGFHGMDGQEVVCETCQGLGRHLTPFGSHLFEMLVWAGNPRPLVTQEELDKKNKAYWIRFEAGREKIRLIEEAAAKARQAQAAADAKVAEKVNRDYQTALARLEAETEAKLSGA